MFFHDIIAIKTSPGSCVLSISEETTPPKKAKFDIGAYLERKADLEEKRLELEEKKLNAEKAERRSFIEVLMKLAN